MTAATKPLGALTARDLMTADVVSVPQEMSLQGAARLMSRASISGAPVVDADGRCVGVLSATDFMVWAENNGEPGRPSNPGCMVSPWEVVEPESLPAEKVSRYMTADPVLVSPTATVGDLARMMVDAHIHRVIVVDDDNRPVGVVSSMDILGAVARATHRVPVKAD